MEVKKTLKVEELEVSNYDTAHEVTFKAKDNNYKLYMQLPHTADSQHALLEKNGELLSDCMLDSYFSEDELNTLLEEIDKKYTRLELGMLAEIGHIDHTREDEFELHPISDYFNTAIYTLKSKV